MQEPHLRLNILPESRGQPVHTPPPQLSTGPEGVSVPQLGLRDTKMIPASATPCLPHAAPQSAGPQGAGRALLPGAGARGQSPELGW